MFTFAILIGIYSYLVFAMGLLGLLFKPIIIAATILFIFFVTAAFRDQMKIHKPFLLVRRLLREGVSLGKLEKLFLGVIILLAFVNLIGALGPELGFDALWYHLTLPKLYLENHSVFYISGGLLYYSLMPKLTEMLYVSALAINGEILAKLVHFVFGILSCIALFKLSREFFSTKTSLIAVVIFYSNLVVAWQSITAYVDLARTFFEIMALWGFVRWWKKGERKWLVESAIMLGLAISTKLLAVGSLVIFSVLIVYKTFFKPVILERSGNAAIESQTRRSYQSLRGFQDDKRSKERLKKLFIGVFVYWVICLLIPLPWFVFSYIHTGNPVYPFFTDLYKVGLSVELLNPFRFIREVWGVFIGSSDPISPIYLISLPLVILFFFRHLRDSGQDGYQTVTRQARMTIFQTITIYSFIAVIVWYFTPRTGGGRFILPYLPVFSLLVAAVIEKIKDKSIRMVLISVIIIVSVISILHRGIANSKYIPVVVGAQSKSDFLEKHLNFSFGDFYDTDGYFKTYIKATDKVLLYGFHNLYYVDFPFIDSSWVEKGDPFNYVAVQNTPSADGLPKRFKDWELIYQNPKTNVKLYSKGGIKWTY